MLRKCSASKFYQGVTFGAALGAFTALTPAIAATQSTDFSMDSSVFQKVVACDQAPTLVEQIKACAKEVGVKGTLQVLDADLLNKRHSKKEALRKGISNEIAKGFNAAGFNAEGGTQNLRESHIDNVVYAIRNYQPTIISTRSNDKLVSSIVVGSMEKAEDEVLRKHFFVNTLPRTDAAWHEYGHAVGKQTLKGVKNWYPVGDKLPKTLSSTVLKDDQLSDDSVLYIRNNQLDEMNADNTAAFMAARKGDYGKAEEIARFRAFGFMDNVNSLNKAAARLDGLRTAHLTVTYGNVKAAKEVADFVKKIEAKDWDGVESEIQRSFRGYYNNEEAASHKTSSIMYDLKEVGLRGMSVKGIGELSAALAADKVMSPSEIRATYVLAIELGQVDTPINGKILGNLERLSDSQKDYIKTHISVNRELSVRKKEAFLQKSKTGPALDNDLSGPEKPTQPSTPDPARSFRPDRLGL